MRAVIVGVVLLVLGALGGAAWYFLLYDDGRDVAATAAADAFATAWSTQDWTALSTATTAPDAGTAHAAVVEQVGAEAVGVVIESLDLTQIDDGFAPATFVVQYALGALGTWQYSGAFDVIEIDEEWRVDWSPSVLHPDLQEGWSFRRTRFWPPRAPILGPDGSDLAGVGQVVIVGIEPRRVTDPSVVVDAIERLTPASGEDASAILDRSDLRDDWFYPVVEMARLEYDAVREELRPVPGLVFQEATTRAGASAATEELVGRVDEITAEQLRELGSPYEVGDTVGRTGLEASLERRLAGSPGGAIELVDDAGQTVQTVHRAEPVMPEPVELTLDARIQDAAAAAFEGVEQPGGMAVLDASSGAVRAALSRPADGFPRALSGRYAPGSTFKIVTAAALLVAGTSPADPVDCPEQINAGGRLFTNAGDAALGTIPFAEAFAESCNTAFIGAAAELPEGVLAETAALFGFGTGEEGSYDVAGRSVPAEFPEPADAAEAAAAAIGQARLLASPLQMASVAATATTGTWYRPYLLVEDVSTGVEVLTAQVVDDLTEMMRAVVADGTGTAVQTPGAIGKTGTAQRDGGAEDAWFVGAYDGLAFAVVVEGGGGGGAVAAPIAERFLQALGR